MERRRRTTRSRRNNDIPQNLECYFCKAKESPGFKDILKLRRFISDRGKIVASTRTGVCSKHQRKLSTEIKRARFLALIPYTEGHAL